MSSLTRTLGIDLGGAVSPTTGFAVLEGAARPRLLAAGQPVRSRHPEQAEKRLLELVDRHAPDRIAIDAPLTLPPCLTCPAYCRGPGPECELEAARTMWAAKHNPVSQRQCEVVLHASVGVRPMPTMQIGVIAGRAIAFGRKLSNRGAAPSVMQRGEVLEVYPRATLRRLSDNESRLRLRDKGESPHDFRTRVVDALGDRIDGLDHKPALLRDGHAFDALIAAYTAWLAPDGLEPPPPDFNLASGWIWFPRAGV